MELCPPPILVVNESITDYVIPTENAPYAIATDDLGYLYIANNYEIAQMTLIGTYRRILQTGLTYNQSPIAIDNAGQILLVANVQQLWSIQTQSLARVLFPSQTFDNIGGVTWAQDTQTAYVADNNTIWVLNIIAGIVLQSIVNPTLFLNLSSICFVAPFNLYVMSNVVDMSGNVVTYQNQIIQINVETTPPSPIVVVPGTWDAYTSFSVRRNGDFFYIVSPVTDLITECDIHGNIIRQLYVGAGSGARSCTTDFANNIYVTDTNHNQILRINPISTESLSTGFEQPVALMCDPIHGFLYILDRSLETLYYIAADALNLYVLPEYLPLPNPSHLLNSPSSAVVDGQINFLYVSDTNNRCIQQYSLASSNQALWVASLGLGDTPVFQRPLVIAIHPISSTLYVCDGAPSGTIIYSLSPTTNIKQVFVASSFVCATMAVDTERGLLLASDGFSTATAWSLSTATIVAYPYGPVLTPILSLAFASTKFLYVADSVGIQQRSVFTGEILQQIILPNVQFVTMDTTDPQGYSIFVLAQNKISQITMSHSFPRTPYLVAPPARRRLRCQTPAQYKQIQYGYNDPTITKFQRYSQLIRTSKRVQIMYPQLAAAYNCNQTRKNLTITPVSYLFNRPQSIVADNLGNYWVADSQSIVSGPSLIPVINGFNQSVLMLALSPDASILYVAQTTQILCYQLSNSPPTVSVLPNTFTFIGGVAVSKQTKRLIVSDNQIIHNVDSQGRFDTQVTSPEFFQLGECCVAASNTIYVLTLYATTTTPSNQTQFYQKVIGFVYPLYRRRVQTLADSDIHTIVTGLPEQGVTMSSDPIDIGLWLAFANQVIHYDNNGAVIQTISITIPTPKSFAVSSGTGGGNGVVLYLCSANQVDILTTSQQNIMTTTSTAPYSGHVVAVCESNEIQGMIVLELDNIYLNNESMCGEGTGLNSATAMAFDNSNTNLLYVSDTNNGRIIQFNISVSSLWSQTIFGVGYLVMPSGIVVDSTGSLWICDLNRVKRLTLDGVMTRLDAIFMNAIGVALLGTGDVLVVDTNQNFVLRYNSQTGGWIASIGTGFSNPVAIVVDSTNRIYVADAGNNRVLRLTPDLTLSIWTQTTVLTGIYGLISLSIGKNDDVLVLNTNTITRISYN